MTDPWSAPDPWERAYGSPAGGWGAPQEPPRPPGPPASRWLPLAVVVVLALVAAGIAVVARRDPQRQPVAGPTPVASAPAPKPQKTAPPVKKPAARKPTKAPAPQPARTYSAPPGGIPVRGRIVDEHGRPVGGARVGLQRHEGFWEGLGRGLAAVFTLGLACLADVCEVPYGVGHTDASGAYTVFLEHDVDDYDLTVESGSTVFSSRIDFAGKPLRLPDVRMWHPTPRATVEGGQVRVRYRPPPAVLGSWDGTGGTIEDAQGNTVLALGDVRPGTAFDARLVEDAPVRLAVSVAVRAKIGKGTYRAAYPFRAGRRPLSRGRACTENGPSGRPVRNAPCGLTDGNLAAQWQPKVPEYQCPRGEHDCLRRVVIDLGSAKRVRYVVVRGPWSSDVTVETSADGRTWQRLSQEPAETYGTTVRGGDVTARYVRVKVPAFGFGYSDLSEVSVF